MVLLYMVLHGSHQYTPNNVGIYIAYMDPSWVMLHVLLAINPNQCFLECWVVTGRGSSRSLGRTTSLSGNPFWSLNLPSSSAAQSRRPGGFLKALTFVSLGQRRCDFWRGCHVVMWVMSSGNGFPKLNHIEILRIFNCSPEGWDVEMS